MASTSRSTPSGPTCRCQRHVVGRVDLPTCVRHNRWVALIFFQSAFKHQISEQRIRYVISHYHPSLVQPPAPPGRPNEQIVYLGDDARGTALEVMTVMTSIGDEAVIHAMRLRAKYLPDYRQRLVRP